MATTIATLAAKLSLDTKGWKTGFESAGVSAKAFVQVADGVDNKLRSLIRRGLAFGAAFLSIRAGIRGLSQQFAEVDQIAKTGRRLGIATEKLVGLRFAAKQTGVDAKTLELGLQRMTRRISEAAQGSGEAKKALAELGLDAKQLNRLSPDQQFRKLGDSLMQIPNQADRVRLAMRLFDSEGVKLIQTLQGGSASLDEFQRRAKELGLTFDEVDAAKIEAANDAISEMKLAFSALFRQLAIQLAPFITALAKQFTNFGKQGAGVASAIVGAFKGVARFFAKIGDFIRHITDGIRILLHQLSKLGHFLGTIDDKTMKARQRAFDRAVGAKLPSEKLDEFFQQVERDAELARRQVKALDKGVTAVGDGASVGFAAGSPAALTRGSVEAFSQARQGGAGILNEMNQHQEDAAMSLREILFEIRRGNSRGLALIPAGF